jgi:hypothetical protein
MRPSSQFGLPMAVLGAFQNDILEILFGTLLRYRPRVFLKIQGRRERARGGNFYRGLVHK